MNYIVGQQVMYRYWGWVTGDGWAWRWKTVTVVKVKSKGLVIRYPHGWEHFCHDPELSIRQITAIVPVSPAITHRESTFKRVSKVPFQEGDRVRVKEGAYAGRVGTIAKLFFYEENPTMSFCLISWRPQLDAPDSIYKLHQIERVTEEPLTTVSCQMCKWTHAAPKDEALNALKQHLAEHNKKPAKTPIPCATCGNPAAPEAIGGNGKVYCIACGEHLLHDKAQTSNVRLLEKNADVIAFMKEIGLSVWGSADSVIRNGDGWYIKLWQSLAEAKQAIQDAGYAVDGYGFEVSPGHHRCCVYFSAVDPTVIPETPDLIFCTNCGQPVSANVMKDAYKPCCLKCGTRLVIEPPVKTEAEKIDAAPAPRRIEQPKQDQIPTVQLSLF